MCYKGGEKRDDRRLKEREEPFNWRRERVGGYEQRSLSRYGGEIFCLLDNWSSRNKKWLCLGTWSMKVVERIRR